MVTLNSGIQKNIFFQDFSCTQGRMCVYGRYAPDKINKWNLVDRDESLCGISNKLLAISQAGTDVPRLDWMKRVLLND